MAEEAETSPAELGKLACAIIGIALNPTMHTILRVIHLDSPKLRNVKRAGWYRLSKHITV